MRIATFAITFTNKAVHEMKSRIVGSLSEFAKDEPQKRRFDAGRAKDTAFRLSSKKTKSQQIIKHIIHNMCLIFRPSINYSQSDSCFCPI
jgi:ATP-dependent exoDNAse (exonuclease V) beta subunit